jgi:hypothetical protein
MNKVYHSPALPKTDAENQKPESTPSGFKKLASHPAITVFVTNQDFLRAL